MEIRVQGAAAMGVGETRVFPLPAAPPGPGAGGEEGFVIRCVEGFRAYRNRCRHWPVPLDLGDGDFYYAAIDRITCKTHGATYDPASGFCDSGPCVGAVLESYPVRQEAGDLLVAVPGPDSPLSQTSA